MKVGVYSPCAAPRRLSVVIPCYNAAATLAVQLDALVALTCAPWEVIVVDNGSTDGSRALAEGYRDRLPRLQVIDAPHRRGAAVARNAGAAAASGEFVAFCDADDEVAPGWVEGLLDVLADNDFAASHFDMKKLNSDKSAMNRTQSCSLQDAYGFLPHAGGCGLAIRLSLHRELGGFDERMRYLEDTDYCWRAQLAGTPLVFAANAVVHVRNRVTPAQNFTRAWHWSAREVQLYRRYRRTGFPRPDNRAAIREWLRLVRQMSFVVRGRCQMSNGLAWALGARVGRLVGCVLYLTPMF